MAGMVAQSEQRERLRTRTGEGSSASWSHLYTTLGRLETISKAMKGSPWKESGNEKSLICGSSVSGQCGERLGEATLQLAVRPELEI